MLLLRTCCKNIAVYGFGNHIQNPAPSWSYRYHESLCSWIWWQWVFLESQFSLTKCNEILCGVYGTIYGSWIWLPRRGKDGYGVKRETYSLSLLISSCFRRERCGWSTLYNWWIHSYPGHWLYSHWGRAKVVLMVANCLIRVLCDVI